MLWRDAAWLGYLERPSAFAASGPCGRETRDRALGDEFALELGERSEDREDQLSGGRRGVDRGALPAR